MAASRIKSSDTKGRELATTTRRPSAPAMKRRALLELFLGGRKATTLRAYEGDLADFAAWANQGDAAAACNWLFALDGAEANAQVLAYRAALTDRKLSAATIARRLAALRSMGKLARITGVCSWKLEVEAPRVEAYRDTAGPGGDGVEKMLDLAQAEARTGDPTALRDLALVRLLYTLGMRRAEAVGLDLGDIELDTKGEPVALRAVGKGRTDHERFTLPRATAQALAAWLRARGQDSGPVFVRLDRGRGDHLGRLSTESIRKIVRDLGKRAGLTRPVSPHQLRHAAITDLLDRTGGDVRRVARFSRHRDLRTLTVYDDRRRDDPGELAALLDSVGAPG